MRIQQLLIGEACLTPFLRFFFQSLDDPYSRGRMFHDPLGDFGGSYDPALGDPRGSHGVEFGGGRGGPRTAGGPGAVFGPDPLREEERRYFSSDSVPMHSESYPVQPPLQQSLPPSLPPPPQQQQQPPPPHRGATAAGGGVPYDDVCAPGYGGGGGMGMGMGMGRRAPRGGGHEFGGESDMESVVSATSAFSSHSAPHARGRRMMHPGAMQQG